MVDKISGQVAYAVMSFGGFLGIGESYHPLPWRVLKYDVRQGGMSSISIAGGSREPRAIQRAICPTGLIAPTVTGSTTTTGCHLTAFELSRHSNTRTATLVGRSCH
jgi:hypothetical protein